jgi:ABC-type transport system involved in cytochrome bd biosynthesis fused ATPase/permease subunit
MEQEPYIFEWDSERENANITLSGGQKQKVAFARMSEAEADIWLLDEPTASLDAESEHELLSILEHERTRRLIIVSSHRQPIWDIADAVLDLDAEGGAAL